MQFNFLDVLKAIHNHKNWALSGMLALSALAATGSAQDVIKDGNFDVPIPQGIGGLQTFNVGQAFGAWRVTVGNVDVMDRGGRNFKDMTYPGKAIDIAGSKPGTIVQTIETRIGNIYTVNLAYAGNFSNSTYTKGLTAKAGVDTRTVYVTKPLGWSLSALKWKTLSFTFKASASTTDIELKSLQTGLQNEGVIVTEVEVIASPPPALSTVSVPLPSDLNQFVKDRNKAILLGKSLFWDMQVGSDGRTACATCHHNAGIDQRTVNTLHPGAPGSTFGPQLPGQAELGAEARAKFRGANKQLVAGDFPFHQVANPIGDHEGNPVLRDTMEVVGSQGVVKKTFNGIVPGNPVDNGTLVSDPIFNVNGANARQVTGRNSPTMINAVFFDRLFWDGRANHFFNGVNPFGDLDPSARVLKRASTTTTTTTWGWKWKQLLWYGYWAWEPTTTTQTTEKLEPTKILLNNAALASQAVGPPLNDVEMSWDQRRFKELGRKMLSLTPLAQQKVHATDSVLGLYANTAGTGLKNTSYSQLIREAFHDVWWSSPQSQDGFTHMEANFSLYWGLALMMYESTLVSDKAPYDSFASGNTTALSDSAKRGLRIFQNEGKCINCHGGPEFAGATISELRPNGKAELIEFMAMAQGNAFYDSGFYNTGVRKTLEDIAVGAKHPQFGPLSYSARRQMGQNIGQDVSVPAGARIAVNGAFKSSSLRNIELTGPYFHNGGARTLRESVEFYVRGADFLKENIADLDPDVDGIPELQNNPAGVDDVVNFMKSLTDERVRYQKAPFDHPELIIPNGHVGVSNGVATDNNVVIPAVGASGGAAIIPFEQIVK